MPNLPRSAQVLFREEQQFRQPWLWALLVFGLVVALGATANTLFIISRRACAVPTSFWLSIAFPSAFMLLVNALFFYTSLVTEVRSDGISVSFRPFQLKPVRITYSEITACAAVTYRPLPSTAAGGSSGAGPARPTASPATWGFC
jgi:hypothetical protein